MKRAIVGLVLMLSLGGIVTASPTGKLLVRSHNGSDWDLYIMDEDGSNLRAIDTNPDSAYHADFSPDGKTILYTLWNGSTNDFYQVAAAGGIPSLVAADLTNEVCVAWGSTPDHFYYNKNTGGTCGHRSREIHRRALDGAWDEVVLSTLNVYFTDVQEHLNKMVCVDLIPPACWSPYQVLVTYDADGTNRYVLPPTDDGKGDTEGRISPDGQYVLYYKSDSASGWQMPTNIYRIKYDGTEQERLTNYVGDYYANRPVWCDNDSFFYSLATGNSMNGVLHYYTISTGEDIVIPCGLSNCTPVDFLVVAPAIEAPVDIDPDVLNLKSRGKWITCYIWLPEPYDVADIDPDTILLNGQVGSDWSWIDEAEQMLMAKFPRSEAQEILEPGEVELTVTGELLDGTKFEGSDTIRVIDKGAGK